MNVERLKVLARFLRTEVPREQFDLDSWATDQDFESCGTTACAFGWATQIPEFNEAGLRLAEGLSSPVPKYQGCGGFGAAAQFFHIPWSAAVLLFGPDSYDKDDRTPNSVAKRIDTLVELVQ